MPRPSFRLLRQLRGLESSYQWSSSSPAIYSIGLSYAGKDSPPFVPPNSPYPRTGFANLPSGKSDKIREWVRSSGKLPAGRGELDSAVAGGWTEEVKERVVKWGAGEDFFAIETPWTVHSVSGEDQSSKLRYVLIFRIHTSLVKARLRRTRYTWRYQTEWADGLIPSIRLSSVKVSCFITLNPHGRHQSRAHRWTI